MLISNRLCQVLFLHIKMTFHGSAAAESLQDALKQLFLIDAIDENGTITSIGKTMAGILFLFISSKCLHATY